MKFIKWADNHRWFYTFAIISFMIVPIIVQIITTLISGQNGQGDWLGFWGSYLGIIPSGLIAYAVAKYQIDNEQKRLKEQFNQTKYIEDLTRINNKLRNFDSVFEYGVSHQYLLKDKSEAIQHYNKSDDELLDDMMNNLSTYMYKEKIFDSIAILLLDIEMMPKVRGSEVYKSIYELNEKLIDLSRWFGYVNSDSVPSGEGENAYIGLIDKYKDCKSAYYRVLKQIADEVYAT